jgi:hypothetical protein
VTRHDRDFPGWGWTDPPIVGRVDSCVACGAELGVGRFCLNCGHPIGAPAPAPAPAPTPDPAPLPVEQQPIAPPVQAADPTPVAPTNPPDLPAEPPGEPPVEPPAPGPHRHEWDPQEELLPYEEVDDLDSDVPIRGRAWIGWVAGAVLLMGLVLLLLRVFASDDADVATDPTDGGTSSITAPVGGPGDATTEETAAEAPSGVGRPRELAKGAGFDVPATAPPTTDLDGALVAYESGQMGDGDPRTAWRTAGDASGQTITVALSQPGVVTRVGLLNGYAKQVAGVDWYPHNRRILSVTWGFDDGTSVEQTFAERPAVQRLTVPPVQTGTVTITITSATPPGSGNLGRDYTAISEVSIIGKRAG